MSRDTVNTCVFYVREVEAQCYDCKWALEPTVVDPGPDEEGGTSFTETHFPIDVNRVVRCPNCGLRNRIGVAPVGRVLKGGTRKEIAAADRRWAEAQPEITEDML